MKIKKTKKIKCPDCKKMISRDDLGYSQKGIMTYNISFNKDGMIEYQEDEFEANGGGSFYHSECGITNLSDEDLEILGVEE